MVEALDSPPDPASKRRRGVREGFQAGTLPFQKGNMVPVNTKADHQQFVEDVISLTDRLIKFLRTPVPSESTEYLFYVSLLWQLRQQVSEMADRSRELRKGMSNL